MLTFAGHVCHQPPSYFRYIVLCEVDGDVVDFTECGHCSKCSAVEGCRICINIRNPY